MIPWTLYSSIKPFLAYTVQQHPHRAENEEAQKADFMENTHLNKSLSIDVDVELHNGSTGFSHNAAYLRDVIYARLCKVDEDGIFLIPFSSKASQDDRAPKRSRVATSVTEDSSSKKVATIEVEARSIGNEVHSNSTLAKVAPGKKLKRPSNGKKDKELSPSLIDSSLMLEEPIAPGTFPSAADVNIEVSRAPSPQAKVITTETEVPITPSTPNVEALSTPSLAQTEIHVIMVLQVVEIPPSLATRANRKMGQSSVKELTRKEDGDIALVELSVNKGSTEED
ncbi:hypothetical protein ACFE04_004097 [Oxalis oulophora]